MDIIASHQHGLAEQLANEAAALAGRDRDAVQRAIVGHHLYQHSGGRHAFALIAAGASLALDRRLARLAKAAVRWPRRDEALAGRLETFAGQARAIDRERCEALLLAYRLATTPGLRGADVGGDASLAGAYGAGDAREDYVTHLRWAEARWGVRIEAAIDALAWTKPPRDLAKAVAALRLPIESFDRAARKGWARTERALTADKALPRGFAGNPGQHYYAIQRALADKRRKLTGEWPDFDPAEAVAIAA